MTVIPGGPGLMVASRDMGLVLHPRTPKGIRVFRSQLVPHRLQYPVKTATGQRWIVLDGLEW